MTSILLHCYSLINKNHFSLSFCTLSPVELSVNMFGRSDMYTRHSAVQGVCQGRHTDWPYIDAAVLLSRQKMRSEIPHGQQMHHQVSKQHLRHLSFDRSRRSVVDISVRQACAIKSLSLTGTSYTICLFSSAAQPIRWPTVLC